MVNPMIAEIIMFGGNFAPRGWAKCEGQLLPISSNTALFSIIGTMYGGDGRSTFGLPDFRSRSAVSPGQGPGLSNYRQGPGGGRETVTLNTTNLPAHDHAVSASLKASFTPPSGGGTLTNPNGANLSSSGETIYTTNAANQTMAADSVAVALGNTGGGQDFSIVQPWCAVQFIIALQGVYPSRS
ncbi:MAG: tail fiber protein [Crocinitomicaceae bacterium]|nr:tail fiber protein [Crocinitomicaceae bacterium]